MKKGSTCLESTTGAGKRSPRETIDDDQGWTWETRRAGFAAWIKRGAVAEEGQRGDEQ